MVLLLTTLTPKSPPSPPAPASPLPKLKLSKNETPPPVAVPETPPPKPKRFSLVMPGLFPKLGIAPLKSIPSQFHIAPRFNAGAKVGGIKPKVLPNVGIPI